MKKRLMETLRTHRLTAQGNCAQLDYMPILYEGYDNTFSQEQWEAFLAHVYKAIK